MNFDRQAVKANGKAAFQANYWPMVGITLLGAVIIGAIACATAIPAVGFVVAVIVLPVITVGYETMYYPIYMGKQVEIEDMFIGFKNKRFGHILGGYWYQQLFITLWTCLFIIPGIVKAYAYSMAPYILVFEPEVDPTDALKRSMELTKGHKWDLFIFDLSFLGWALLSAITCDIVGIFYFTPYYQTAKAGLYDHLKRLNGEVDVIDATATPVDETVDPQPVPQAAFVLEEAIEEPSTTDETTPTDEQ